MLPLNLRLRELRNIDAETTLTQKDLADQLGTSAALVSSWERAQAIPPRARIVDYAAIFSTDGTDGLLAELLDLRDDAVLAIQVMMLPAPKDRHPLESASEMPTLMEIMQEIRYLLVQIRDRLPRI